MTETKTRSFFQTSVGKKYIMGLTGLIWAGFVFVHMAGNLLILVGPKAYNSYAHMLATGEITIIVEVVLVLAFLAHVWTAISLTRMNRKAHGSSRYAMQPNGEKAAAAASKTMAVQGSIVLVFLITHLATFKYGTNYETTVNGTVMRDLHRLVVEIFKQPGYVGWYAVALLFLGFHLSHGVRSTVQSLGVLNDRIAPTAKKVGLIYSIVVFAGFIVQPIYVYFIAG